MKNHSRWICSATRLVFGLSLLFGGVCTTASAQGFRGGDSGRGSGDSGRGSSGGGFSSSPEDSFRRLDRNQNGQIDPDELGFMRDIFARTGMDVSRPISQQAFIQGSQKLREQFEQARSSGSAPQMRISTGGSGGPPSFGGGPPSFGGGPPSFGGGPPSFGGGPSGGFRSQGESDRRSDESSDRDSRRSDRDRDTGRGGDSNSSGKSSKKTAKPKVRITKSLPDDYRGKDKNGDGQIGLYEWDRQAFAQFFDLDRNGDGLLTADELIAAAKKSSAPSAVSSSGAATPAIALSSSSGTSPTTEFARPSGGGSTTPAKAAPPVELTAGMKAFVGLDRNGDGTLSDEEWQRSRTARGKFEKAGIAVSIPIQQAQFLELYNKAEAQ